MRQLLSSDMIKLKRSWFLEVTAAVPILMCLLMSVFFWYYRNTGMEPFKIWGVVFEFLFLILNPVIFVTIAVIASILSSIEHQSSMWKQLLCMPFSKTSFYMTRIGLVLSAALGVGAIMTAGTYFLGSLFGLTDGMHFSQFFVHIFFPFLISIPYLCFQTWLSLTVQHQALPISAGIAAVFIGPLMKDWAVWTPWGFLSAYSVPVSIPEGAVIGATADYTIDWSFLIIMIPLTCMLLLIGNLHFHQKEFH
ncbi:ABC transporter permease [Metabacillus indicus]|uniref:ABC transporter permease n=1 Tax=Metabacillus indicus TaxID=246786 RepID=UPI002492251A|nr:ABC transporter permease [Metabacillus indicus]